MSTSNDEEKQHKTFKTNDGERCFNDCPRCAYLARIEREDRAAASKPYRPWMDAR